MGVDPFSMPEAPPPPLPPRSSLLTWVGVSLGVIFASTALIFLWTRPTPEPESAAKTRYEREYKVRRDALAKECEADGLRLRCTLSHGTVAFRASLWETCGCVP